MTEPQTPVATKSDRKAKFIFLVVLIIVGFVVWRMSQQPPVWPGASTDLDKTLATAKEQNKEVLVLFMDSPPGETTRNMLKGQLARPQNKEAVAKILTVQQSISSLDSDLAKKYEIVKLPTLLLLDPSGKELNRNEGSIGEVEFRSDFLSRKTIVPPPSKRGGSPR